MKTETIPKVEKEPVTSPSKMELYDLYAPAVYGKILSIVDNRPIADKMLEKVFINALKHKNIPVYKLHTPLISLLNHSTEKTNKTIKALNIFRECCAGASIHIADQE
jgi:hypothetical protein